MKVSIISPIYKGTSYIPALIEQAIMCKEYAGENIDVELVLSNDDPNSPLRDIQSDLIEVKVINCTKNQGIQKARVDGLEQATGEYVVFMDQDDRIMPEYIKSQLQKIKDADAVVCRCMNEKRLNYNNTSVFEEMITKEYMLTKGNPIVSPGQVLLRRKSIPDIWKQNILKVSGADDYFLWLSMLAENAGFALNQDVLFERVVNGINTSLNTNRMIESEMELFDLIRSLRLFTQQKDEDWSNLEQAIIRRQVKLLDKFRLLFFTLNNTLLLQENNVLLCDILRQKGINTLAIYGVGYVGKRIYGILKNTTVEVCCMADRNASFLEAELPIYTLENLPINIDGILITLQDGTESIRKKLQALYPHMQVIILTDLINEQLMIDEFTHKY